MQDLARVTVTLYKNQEILQGSLQRLAASEGSLDDQVAVITRMFFLHANEVRTKLGLEPFTDVFVESLFKSWYDFKKRSDAKVHMTTWVKGGDLSSLPAEPEVKEQVPEEELTEPVVFGGDYAQGSDGNETSEDSGSGTETLDAVPGVREPDPPLQQEEGRVREVPEVSTELQKRADEVA